MSRIRSPVTSRSNWAKGKRTFSVSRDTNEICRERDGFFRHRVVLSAGMIAVRGRIQREGKVFHLVASNQDVQTSLRNVHEMTKIAEYEFHPIGMSCARARRQMLAVRRFSATTPRGSHR